MLSAALLLLLCSDVELEEDDVALLDYVVLALLPVFASLLDRSLRAWAAGVGPALSLSLYIYIY